MQNAAEVWTETENNEIDGENAANTFYIWWRIMKINVL
jgi:hypothetical protein